MNHLYLIVVKERWQHSS